ncbi:MAG: DUF4276 family protein [bacterium]|nr:DUF4276 family protein [bacterium]
MIHVLIVCEGQTEEMFVNRVLQPHFASVGTFVEPRLIATSLRGKGGRLNRDRVLRYLRNTLRERSDVYVTTFFDLYGLKPDFPGFSESTLHVDPVGRADAIEAVFHQTVVEITRCLPDRFFPHIQPFEFESLLFSNLDRLPEVDPAWQSQVGSLREVREMFTTPEHINDGEDTHPSARLRPLRGYKKVLHGAAITHRIGLRSIRSECRHFGRWLSRLENLPLLRHKD